MSFQMAEAERLLGAIANIGVVTAVYPARASARVQIGDLLTPEIQILQLSAGARQFWWMPSVGEQVVVLAPGGDIARGVLIGSIYAGNAPSSDGAEPRINLAGGHMVIDGDLTITGTLHINGATTCDGDVTGGGISLMTHKHTGVVIGPAKTGEPE